MTRFSWGGPDRLLRLEERFEGLPGWQAWKELIEIVADPDTPNRELFNAFDYFLRSVDRIDPNLVKDCVFISHRQKDWRRAEEVAKIVSATGRDYWLDIHDPMLLWINGTKTNIGTSAGAILLAAIIEIALLNSTHVITLHTANSAGSAWIPYELGRAKARRIFSSNAAGWFDHPTILPATCPEYLHLAHQTLSDQDVEDWLRKRGRYN
jgi:hypothetical protein